MGYLFTEEDRARIAEDAMADQFHAELTERLLGQSMNWIMHFMGFVKGINQLDDPFWRILGMFAVLGIQSHAIANCWYEDEDEDSG